MVGAREQNGTGLANALVLKNIHQTWRRQVGTVAEEAAIQARWERIWSHLARALLEGATARDLAGFEAQLVADVHGPDYTIVDLYRETRHLKGAVAEVLSGLGEVRALDRLDPMLARLFEGCLAKTSLVNERVLDGSARGFCQVDPHGRIVAANGSIHRLLQIESCLGLHLPEFFGDLAPVVSQALSGESGEVPVLRRMDMVLEGGRKVPVTAEFGPIVIEGKVHGGYAFLVDVSSLIEAEYKAYEASKLGIVKFDLSLRITYANHTARTIFGDENNQLVGVTAQEIFPDRKAQAKIRNEFALRKAGKGSTYELEYVRKSDGRTVPLRVNAMPQYDNLGAMTGVFVVIEDIQIAKVGQKIQNLIQEHNKGHHLFKAMFKELRDLIEFDFGSVAIYTNDMTMARTIHFHPRPSPLWPTLWFPISPDLKQWIEGRTKGPLWQPTIEAFLTNQKGTDEIAHDPTVERLIEEGYKGFICYPISEAGRVIAVVCLMSRKEDHFNEEHFKILDSLPIDRVVRTGLAYRDRAEHRFLHELNKQITIQDNTADVAKAIVNRLARFFQWQNVSIFKVNRVRNVLALLAQAEGPVEGFQLPDNYSQRLDEGILGLALERGEAVKIDDTERKEGDTLHYIASNPRARSELCLPIQILGETVWMLNLEDARLNAFSKQDVDTLNRVIVDIESTLVTTFRSMISNEIFEVVSDGVVIADSEGRMLKINPRARAILKIPTGKTREHSLSDFVPDKKMRRFLIEGSQIAPTRVMFQILPGEMVPMLVSGSVLPEEYGRRVIFLKEMKTYEDDMRALEWRRDVHAISEGLGEIVAQTRTPLSLAATLLRRAGRSIAEETARELIERAGQQLSRAEVTYDRVSLSVEPDQPVAKKRLSLVQLAGTALDELGVRRTNEVELALGDNLPPVCGNAFELSFVIKSIMGYLLRAKPLDEKVAIAGGIDGEKVWMALSAQTGRSAADAPLDGWQEATEQARAQVVLGEHTIRRFVVNHHGGTYRRASQDGHEIFTIEISESG